MQHELDPRTQRNRELIARATEVCATSVQLRSRYVQNIEHCLHVARVLGATRRRFWLRRFALSGRSQATDTGAFPD